MFSTLILVFCFGYLAIVFEQKIGVDKSASSLLTGVLLWTIVSTSGTFQKDYILDFLEHNVADIAGVLFFLMAAMAIVELIDAYKGFEILSGVIKTKNKRTLLWIISFIAFFLSAILDNLTTSIILVSLLRKLIKNSEDRLMFSAMIVIAANAGLVAGGRCYHYHAVGRRPNKFSSAY
jgi:Na+/H+ antiporter NhaD/arsenite permease-like protein